MAKKTSRKQVVEQLLKTDANFRRLYARVVAGNGGREPSSEEIGRQLAERIAQRRATS
jgi:hypothetical protein